MKVQQKGAGALVKDIVRSGATLAIAAVVIELIGLVLPLISFRANVGFGAMQDGSMNALAMATVPSILTLVTFVAAAASWRVPPMQPYRVLIGIVAIATVPLTMLWAWFFNSISEQVAKASQLMGRDMSGILTLSPGIGMGVLALGGVLLAVSLLKKA